MLVKIDGRSVLIDRQDLPLVESGRWRAKEGKWGCYIFGRIDGIPISLHRAIMGCSTLDGKIVDHINRDTLDNRRANLRFVTPSESSVNRAGGSGVSGYRNVRWKRDGAWEASFMYQGKFYYAGRFQDPKKAGDAAKELRLSIMRGAVD